MRRREFIKIIAGPALAWPLAARAQQGERVRRIGVLMARAATDPEATEDIGAFAQGLAELGWTIGRNVRIEYRYSAGNPELFRKYASELVALAPDVILASGTPSVAALQQSSRSIPIVFAPSPIRSAPALSIASPSRAATPPALCCPNTV